MSASSAAAIPGFRRRCIWPSAGFDVVLLEAHRVGFGASGRNGGQVGSGQRVDQVTLERLVGRDDAHGCGTSAKRPRRWCAG
jgi:hypothetical protein